MKRSPFYALALVPLAFGLSGISVTPVAAQDTSPESCAWSYTAAAAFQENLMGAAADGNGVANLGGLTENWLPTYVWDERASAAAKKGSDGATFLSAGYAEAREFGTRLFIDASFSGMILSSTNPEQVFADQRALFESLRACDLAHGFEPALGVAPPPETVFAILSQQADQRWEQSQARFDALRNITDIQCAARFYLLASIMANDPAFQQVMSEKMEIAGRAAFISVDGFTIERYTEMVQREIENRGSKVTSEADLVPLLEEVNACERKYGEPLTTRN